MIWDDESSGLRFTSSLLNQDRYSSSSSVAFEWNIFHSHDILLGDIHIEASACLHSTPTTSQTKICNLANSGVAFSHVTTQTPNSLNHAHHEAQNRR